MHVLIVEDNLINQTVLRRQMVKAGLTADVANNGQEGLTAIHEADRRSHEGTGPAYDVVLMDLEMPVMDGLTAVKHLREAEAEVDEERPQLVIALTGNARQGQIDQAISMGMDDGECRMQTGECGQWTDIGRHEWRVPRRLWRRDRAASMARVQRAHRG